MVMTFFASPTARRERLIAPEGLPEPVRKDRGQMAAIEALVAGLEPKLASTIQAGLEAMGDAVPLQALIEALEARDIGKVLALLSLDTAQAAFAGVAPAVQNGVYAAGALTAGNIARIAGVQFAFDRLNPRLITWLQTYSLGLIREINDSSREAIRSVLVSGITAGDNPKETARQIKQIVGLTERQAKAVQNYRKELETFHLKTTAGSFGLGNKVNRVNNTQVAILDEDGDNTDGINARRLRDFRFDGQLKRAMTAGKPLSKAQIDKMVGAYARKYKAFRARTIARTEAVRTNAMGVQDAWRQAIESGKVPEALVRRQWVVARDERLCESCAPIPGMNPKEGVKFAEPFATPKGPVALPPVHPNCRCSVFIRQWEPSDLGG